MDKQLCFSSFVFGSYEKYIPYYVYSIGKAYPNAFVKVFSEEDLSENVQKSLTLLIGNGFKNFQIIKLKLPSNYYTDFQIGNGKNQTGKMARWLLDYSYFKEFSFCYVGDVDFIHLPEQIHIVAFHKKNMEKFGLPFSNMVRKDENGEPIRRMAGCHFFETKEYYKAVEPIIKRLNSDKDYRSEYLKGLERNEHFLYELTKEAFNFNDLELSEMYRPWHGLHLGITRGNQNVDLKTIENNTSLTIQETKQFLKEFSEDAVYKQIQDLVFVLELDVILRELKIERPRKWKWESLKIRSNRKLKTLKREIIKFLK